MAQLAKQSPIFGDSAVRVIPNPVPTERFYPEDKGAARAHFSLGENDLVVGFVSDMGLANPLKGSKFLIDAMNEVRLTFPGARLLIVGRSRSGENLPPWIIETGLLTSDEMLRSAYAACDVIAVPSVHDNSPQSISEAAACGRPVVAFNVGGISELIDDGVSGLLIPPLDTASLARGLSRLLSDETARKAFGANGRAKCLREWDPHVIGCQYTDFYRDILAASEQCK
jgi:glycosyltransferase involved in cell wall biosynthesis